MIFGEPGEVVGSGFLQKEHLGGLLCIWNEDSVKSVEVLKSQRILAIKLRNEKDDLDWAIAFAYGPNEESERESFLEQLSEVKS